MKPLNTIFILAVVVVAVVFISRYLKNKSGKAEITPEKATSVSTGLDFGALKTNGKTQVITIIDTTKM